jgi:hypothetical protein
MEIIACVQRYRRVYGLIRSIGMGIEFVVF